MKVHVNVGVDSVIYAKAKEQIENMSAFLEEALRAVVMKHRGPGYKQELEVTIAQAGSLQIKLAETIEKLNVELRSAENEELLGQFDDVLELRDVTAEQVKDTAFVGGLVEVIRTKYPQLRVGVSQIREYVKVRDDYLSSG
jgi:hypothetical protein